MQKLQRHGLGGILLPAGIIIPLNSNTVPNGWTAYSAANNRYILCAQNGSYAIGSTGGQTSIGGSTNNAGGHGSVGPYVQDWRWTLDNGSGAGVSSSANIRGGGTHTCNFYYQPARANFRLIKANEDVKAMPQNGVFLGTADPGGLSAMSLNGYYLRGQSTKSLVGSASSLSGLSSTAHHAHLGGFNVGGGAQLDNGGDHYWSSAVSAGGHNNHSQTSVSISDSIYKSYLAAWTDAASEFKILDGQYAMWESFTPPDKWSLADGNNGTLDMRGRFLNFNSTAKGTNGGSGVISGSGNLSSAGAHLHYNSNDLGDNLWVGYNPHFSYGNHTHTASAGSTAFKPTYISLAFIKYTG